MKLELICTASLLLGASLSIAFGQERPGRPGGERPDPAEMVKHLSERYAALAAFDTDKNAKLDDTEQAAVAKAIEDGSLKAGPPGGPRGGEGTPPKGERPAGERLAGKDVAGHVAKFYESVVTYDMDKDGKLSDTEQTAVITAIKDGSLKLPRPGGRGGRGRGGRPDGPPPAQ
jgi:hypothetical protein